MLKKDRQDATADSTPKLIKNDKKRLSQMKYMKSNTDFTLKIMEIEGEKVRVQLWD